MSKTKKQLAPVRGDEQFAKNKPCVECGKLLSPHGFDQGVPRDSQGRCTDCAPATGGGCGRDRGCEFFRIHRWDPSYRDMLMRIRLCATHEAVRVAELGPGGRLSERAELAAKGAAA